MANTAKVKKIYEMLISGLSGGQAKHSDIVEMATYLAKMPTIGVLPEEFQGVIAEAVNQYEENWSFKAYEPEVMTDGQYDPNSWVYRMQDSIKHDYFERYRHYLRRDGFGEDVIRKIEQTSKKVLSFCADIGISRKAKRDDRQKKGLVVGDVQSGKTANYLGLINVACDYGYKIIVLLAGATNSLRIQTQGRVDEGVIGAVSHTIGTSKTEYIGVGIDKGRYFAVPFTSGRKDFAKAALQANNNQAEDFAKPLVFVVKKNASILRALKEWLRPGQNGIEADSILIIDDESDYASVNTNKPDKDPTIINGLIRDLYNNFPIASYVGFTATPFANVFINPYDESEYKDLFPTNFIIQLRSPDNYFGYEKVFSDPEDERRHLVVLDEGEAGFLPVIHKKDEVFPVLPQSLKDAIFNFAIANVIRTRRGQATKHRSMMINISWLNDVQSKIRDTLLEYIDHIKRIVSQDSLKPLASFLRNTEMARLHEIYTTDPFYSEIRKTISFDDIKAGLNDEVSVFETAIINSRVKGEERFDYDKYKDTGARAILIGGFVLSRGLTLEGLMTSYYSRSAAAYDTLLQMCRWFGYRPKYEDLCRIYINESAIHEFEAVIEAVENLKEQFARMAAGGKTPMQFGLMIKECPETLEVRALLPTAKNKLRHTVQVERLMNFSCVNTDTSKLYKDPKHNLKNKAAIMAFFAEVARLGLSLPDNGSRFIKGVPAKLVAELLSKTIIPYENVKFNGENIAEYIERSAPDELWDVLVANGGKDSPTFEINGVTINAVERRFDARELENIIRVSGKNNRLSEPGMFGAMLDEGQLRQAREHAAQEHAKRPRKSADTLVAQDYLSVDRPPLLLIFPIDLATYTRNETTKLKEPDPKKEALKATLDGELLWGLGVGFPGVEKGVYIRFRLNLIKRDERIIDAYDVEEEDDSDDN